MNYHKGTLSGKRWNTADLAALGDKHGWHGLNLVEFVSISLSESAGYEHAHCRNYHDEAMTDLFAEDVGLMQISINTTVPLAPINPLYDPDNNLKAARDLFDRRGWQPWHGYTYFIATNPAMAGEYIQRAIWGVSNFHRDQYGVKRVPYPKKGMRLRTLIDKITAHEVAAFGSRNAKLRP